MKTNIENKEVLGNKNWGYCDYAEEDKQQNSQ